MADVLGDVLGDGADLHRPPPPIPAVLVLCQRSRSSNDVTVGQTVTGLLNFIQAVLRVGGDFRIRFCTPCEITQGYNPKKRNFSDCDDARHNYPGGGGGGDYADYNLTLNSETLPIIQGKMQNESPPIKSFKYVILHTCPFVFMDFEAISAIMEPGGTMIMTSNNPLLENEIVLVTQKMIYQHLAEPEPHELYSRIHMYFDDTDNPGVYKKKSRKGSRGGKKRRKNKNTLRYKPKKSRSYRNRPYHRTRRSGSKKLK